MINIGIVGYGNLARGVESAIRQNPDMCLKAVFTRRNPDTLTIRTPGVPVVALAEVEKWVGTIDVMILCGGSATDLPQMTPSLVKMFNVVDSFDTHAKIPQHFAAVNAAALETGHTAVISAGWDPGLFSLNRLYAGAVLPQGRDYTFWGTGVSQGHSDAVRRIPGVIDARQYTIEDAIKTMPNYFADYDTTVHFISAEEMARDHAGLPHGGSVIRSGVTGWNGEHKQTIEFKLTLDSNPEFTSSVLVACARALNKMAGRGQTGCKTIFDIAPADMSPLSQEEMLAHLL